MDVFLARSELISLQWLLIACCWCPLLPLFTASCGIRYNNSTTHAGEDATTCTGRFLPQVCQRICHTHGLANLASQCFVYHIYISGISVLAGADCSWILFQKTREVSNDINFQDIKHAANLQHCYATSLSQWLRIWKLPSEGAKWFHSRSRCCDSRDMEGPVPIRCQHRSQTWWIAVTQKKGDFKVMLKAPLEGHFYGENLELD